MGLMCIKGTTSLFHKPAASVVKIGMKVRMLLRPAKLWTVSKQNGIAEDVTLSAIGCRSW